MEILFSSCSQQLCDLAVALSVAAPVLPCLSVSLEVAECKKRRTCTKNHSSTSEHLMMRPSYQTKI